MNVSPAGTGRITADVVESPSAYPASFTCDAIYSLTAHPDTTAGYEFIHWTVDSRDAGEIETGNPLTVSVVDGDKTVTAYFRLAGTRNEPPVADAGEDQIVIRGDRVILNGSGSFDPDDGIRRYVWQQTEGTGVTLTDASAVRPAFIAPAVAGSNAALLKFQLRVEDYAGSSAEDSVTISVGKDMSGHKHGGGGGCFIYEITR